MLNALPVLVVSATRDDRESLARTIRGYGFRTVCCATVSEALSHLGRRPFGLVFCEEVLPDGNFRALTRRADIRVVVVSHRDDWDAFLSVMRAGAFDYVAVPPLLSEEVRRFLWAAVGETSRLQTVVQSAA